MKRSAEDVPPVKAYGTYVEGLKAGQFYGFAPMASGRRRNARFNKHKLLLDPYARSSRAKSAGAPSCLTTPCRTLAVQQ